MNALRIGFIGAVATALCLAAGSPAAAQQKAHAAKATSHMRPKAAPAPANSAVFRGAAAKLGTTPEMMNRAFETAHQENPRLTRSEFVMANMLARDLHARHSSVTARAILDQLKTRKTMRAALQHLGLTRGQAVAAERASWREMRAANKSA